VTLDITVYIQASYLTLLWDVPLLHTMVQKLSTIPHSHCAGDRRLFLSSASATRSLLPRPSKTNSRPGQSQAVTFKASSLHSLAAISRNPGLSDWQIRRPNLVVFNYRLVNNLTVGKGPHGGIEPRSCAVDTAVLSRGDAGSHSRYAKA